MIRLIDLLNENRYAPLYHATTYTGFLSILSQGVIKPNELGYVFLTRDKRYKVGGQATPVTFKIDQEKVRQRYKIRPRVGSISNKDQRIEAEEVVKGQIPLDWVEEIQVPSEIIDRVEEALQSAKEGLEWAKKKKPQAVQSSIDDIAEYEKILNHPKLRTLPA